MVKQQTWWLLAGAILIAILIYFLTDVLAPFLMAAILGYLGNPLVNRLVKLKIPRTFAVSIVFLLLFGIIIILLLLLIPVLERQILLLINNIPTIFNWAEKQFLPWLIKHTDITHFVNIKSLKEALMAYWQEVGSIVGIILSTVTTSGYRIFAFSFNLILIPVVTFYLMRDWNKFIDKIHQLLPRKYEPTVIHLMQQCNEVLGAFFRGQLLVMLFLAIFYSIALTIIDLEFSLLLGVMIGIVSIVPYLGFIVGISTALIIATVQAQGWWHIFNVLIVFAIGQMAESMVLTPLLIGDRIGLHPVAVIFAIMAGGQLFGFTGVLLALPATTIITVILRYIRSLYFGSELYDRENIATE